MPSVEEILKASGLTDEQVKALDAKVTAGFTQVLFTATQTLEQAELAKRAQADQYDKEIAPALDSWANEKAQKDAEIAFYKAQFEGAKAGGFIAHDAPGVPAVPVIPAVPSNIGQRDQGGRFVAGANPVPGSPQYMTREEGFRAVTSAQWFVSEYMRLHNGAPPPDDMENLAAEANSQRIPFRDYVSKKYDFPGKREQIKAAEQKKHDDAIRTEVEAKVNKEWAEKVGNNPNIRVAQTSAFSTIDKAVQAGERKDPLKQTREERHIATRQAIQKEIAAHEAETVQ